MTPGKKIAIIDDEEDMVELMQEILAEEGYEAVAFSSVDEALTTIGNGQGWGLIFTDYRMPEMTGVEFLERLRAQGAKTPLILVSGHAEKAVKEEALAKGATDLLTKPFEFSILVSIAKQYVG